MNDKTFALRTIPYGVYVATAIHPGTLQATAATLHWVTQTSFEPCLVAAAVPAAHPLLALARETGRFALHMLGKDDKPLALRFSRTPVQALTGGLNRGTAALDGVPCFWGRHGTLLLSQGIAVLECAVAAVLEAGDHYPVIAEVIDTHVRLPPHRRPDDMVLHMRELGETIFHGG